MIGHGLVFNQDPMIQINMHIFAAYQGCLCLTVRIRGREMQGTEDPRASEDKRGCRKKAEDMEHVVIMDTVSRGKKGKIRKEE